MLFLQAINLKKSSLNKPPNNTIMKTFQKAYILIPVLMLFVVPFAMAQPSAPPATPIDGGLSALLVAGGLYGVKKIRDARKS